MDKYKYSDSGFILGTGGGGGRFGGMGVEGGFDEECIRGGRVSNSGAGEGVVERFTVDDAGSAPNIRDRLLVLVDRLGIVGGAPDDE